MYIVGITDLWKFLICKTEILNPLDNNSFFPLYLPALETITLLPVSKWAYYFDTQTFALCSLSLSIGDTSWLTFLQFIFSSYIDFIMDVK